MCSIGWRIRLAYLDSGKAERAQKAAAYVAHVKACGKCEAYFKELEEWAMSAGNKR